MARPLFLSYAWVDEEEARPAGDDAAAARRADLA